MPFKKIILTVLVITIISRVVAQQKDTLIYYLDTEDKSVAALHASYLVKVYKEKNTDRLWKRLYMTKADLKLLAVGYCTDSSGNVRQGNYKYYDYKSKLSKLGQFDKDKKEGDWIGYYPSGKTESNYHFSLGKMTGLSTAWYENGNLKDSFDLDKTGNGYGVGYYEDGQKRYEGLFADGIKKGEWKYYYDIPGSHQSMACVFEKDSLLSSICFTPAGEPQSKDCNYEREAMFIGGHDAWIKYLVKTIGKSKYIKYLKVGERYTVVVSFALDDEGTVIEATVEEPGSNEKLDNIAEDIIRQSPHWQPAIQYNQPVKAYRRQPITFAVAE